MERELSTMSIVFYMLFVNNLEISSSYPGNASVVFKLSIIKESRYVKSGISDISRSKPLFLLINITTRKYK